MKQFLTVFRFEFKNYAKNKVFIAITLLAILLLGGVLFFPRLKEAFSSDTQVEEPGQAKVSEDRYLILYLNNPQ